MPRTDRMTYNDRRSLEQLFDSYTPEVIVKTLTDLAYEHSASFTKYDLATLLEWERIAGAFSKARALAAPHEYNEQTKQ